MNPRWKTSLVISWPASKHSSGMPTTSWGSMLYTKLGERTFIQMSACCMSISVKVTHASTQMRHKLYTLVAPMSNLLSILEFSKWEKIPFLFCPPKAHNRDDEGAESTGDHPTCVQWWAHNSIQIEVVISTFFALNHTKWVSRLLAGICWRPPMVRGPRWYWWSLKMYCRSCC